MKIKVLKSKKTQFPSYYTYVSIIVKGEEDKGPQERSLKVIFSKKAEKKLPDDFRGGIVSAKGESVFAPYVYEIKKTEDGKDDYPHVTITDFDSIAPLPQRESTCTFLGVEQDTEETEIEPEEPEQDESGDPNEFPL